MLPPVVASPASLWVPRPPSLYSHRMRVFRQRLREHTAPYAEQLQRVTAPRALQFPELRLVQLDSGRRARAGPAPTPLPRPPGSGRDPGAVPAGKLEALAMLLKKLRSERRRVLIMSQMVLMLDILEMFLNFHFLTYIRIDENANSEQRQVRRASAGHGSPFGPSPGPGLPFPRGPQGRTPVLQEKPGGSTVKARLPATSPVPRQSRRSQLPDPAPRDPATRPPLPAALLQAGEGRAPSGWRTRAVPGPGAGSVLARAVASAPRAAGGHAHGRGSLQGE